MKHLTRLFSTRWSVILGVIGVLSLIFDMVGDPALPITPSAEPSQGTVNLVVIRRFGMFPLAVRQGSFTLGFLLLISVAIVPSAFTRVLRSGRPIHPYLALAWCAGVAAILIGISANLSTAAVSDAGSGLIPLYAAVALCWNLLTRYFPRTSSVP
jgi:hypothetical protein